MRRGCGKWGVLLALAVGGLAVQAAAPEVRVAMDLLQEFGGAQVTDCQSCGVRRPGTSGGIRRDALFEHPPAPGRSARVTYALQLPLIDRGDLLLLAFENAIADGIQPGPAVDGVRFAVEVDGALVFARETRERLWQPAALDLSAHGGKAIRLTLLTDALGNSSYDWAMWGSPRVLHFRGGTVAGAAGGITAGAVALRSRTGETLRGRLRAVGAAGEVAFVAPGAGPDGRPANWAVVEFHFPGSQGAEPSFDTPAEPGQAEMRWGAFAAQPRLVLAGPRRAVNRPGETVALRFAVRNEGRGRLETGEAILAVTVGNDPYPDFAVPGLEPGETWTGDWTWTAPTRPGRWRIVAGMKRRADGTAIGSLDGVVTTYGPAPPLSIENHWMRIDFEGAGNDQGRARVLGRNAAGDWWTVAAWAPLMQVVLDGPDGPLEWNVPFREVSRVYRRGQFELARTFEAREVPDPQGVPWNVSLTVELDPARPEARLGFSWQPKAARRVRQLLGPNLLVGEGSSGEAKAWGLFPGLEYLAAAEPSSNPRDFAPPLHDRRSPHPHKVTIPLMAVTIGPGSREPATNAGRFFAPDSLKDRGDWPGPAGPKDLTVALMWDPLQMWDGRRSFPTPRFASPNFEQGMANHRMALFLPSVPDWVPENGEYAMPPLEIAAGEQLRLEATLVVRTGPVLSAVRSWLERRGGLPAAGFPPRGFQASLDICRKGFLDTVWDATSGKWRHCIDWPVSHAPGFAALLWVDAQVAGDAAERGRSRSRVEEVATRMLADGGPGVFASQANCHIMEWEFPFLYGHLPEALREVDAQVARLAGSQRPEGGWVYEPSGPEQADLGAAGDSVLGTSARRAATLLRHARITGDAGSWSAGEKVLRFLELFVVPRGGQTWECPMYEPDLLAAAYAVAAYVDGYRISGNPRWLHNAVYWAESGVPFVYLWTLPDKPMMLGATIPVFGSTFYSHSWLATPVQWCGLVYAYHLGHLAGELERHGTPEPSGSPLPLALDFKPADWRRMVDLILLSGLRQQETEGPRAGTYPDSISRFEERNPAFLNPEDLMVNLLAQEGHDPDVRTVRIGPPNRRIVISSGARIDNAREVGTSLEFRLRSFRGEPSHTLVTVDKPRGVRVDGKDLAEAPGPLRRAAGWWWDPTSQRLYLTVDHSNETVDVEVRR